MCDSESSFRAKISCPKTGACVMSGFPGLATGIDGEPYLEPHNLRATLSDILGAGATRLVVLTEEAELPEGAFAFLQAGAAQAGLNLSYLPIPDYHAPDATILAAWHRLADGIDTLPRDGGTLAFCCQHGAGRSGTMAALMLIEQGLTADQAVAKVREGFSEAVESENQLIFLQKISGELKLEPHNLDPQ